MSNEIIESLQNEVSTIAISDDNDKKLSDREIACKKHGIDIDLLCSKLAQGLESKKCTIDKLGEEHWEEDKKLQHEWWKSAAEFLGYINGDNGAVVIKDRLIIIRYANQTEEMAGRIHIQQEEIPSDVISMGDRKKFVSNLAGNAIQRAST